MSTFKEQLSQCMQNDPPPCAAVCPFGLDIRDFISKVKRGAFPSAYRMYTNAVGFPGIVSRICPQPCHNACVFKSKDAPISMRELEAAAMKFTPNHNPNKYNLPPRSARVAIIGAGPSGLACALRLAAKKYTVDMYEKEERIGGSLWSLLPQEDFMPELERQFMYETVNYHFNCEISDLSEIQADVIYISTGSSGSTFGRVLSGTGAFATDREGVFLGGGAVGRSPVEAIADGLGAAAAMDRYLKTGGMNEPFRDIPDRFHPDADLLPCSPPIFPAGDQGYTKEEAMAEAGRCQQCKCDACLRYCDLMRSYQKYPKRIEDEVAITLEPVSLSRAARVATRLISTCNHCGMCKQVCPMSIDTGAFLLDSHRKMREKGAMPWAYHEFWLRDMDFSNKEASLLVAPSQTPRYLFFPGCRLGGSQPELVRRAYETLLSREPDTALFLSCCGAPAQWAGEEELHQEVLDRFHQVWQSLGQPTVIFSCMNCRKHFQQHLPQVEATTIYNWLEEQDIPLTNKGQGRTVSVFDPCPSREDPDTQQAVRSLAQKAGFQLQSLPLEGKMAQCCGWGGQVELANPRYIDRVTQSRVDQNDLPYLVYCANCRDVFARKGKSTAHILELLLPKEFPIALDVPPTAPTASQSRENRRSLKRSLCKTYHTEEGYPVKDAHIGAPLLITPELLDKMNRSYLLREDVEAVVDHCEKSGSYLIDRENNTRIGHDLAGNLTIWVVYRNLENCRELVNVYAHRMRIMEGTGHV